MNELKVWDYEGTEVRTVDVNGETWWALKDVCAVLDIKNHNEVQSRLEPDEVGRFDVPHPQNQEKTIEMVFVNESGLYSLILRSDKPQAKPFRRWVTHKVLPDIRKNGIYVDSTLTESDEALRKKVADLEQYVQALRKNSGELNIVTTRKNLGDTKNLYVKYIRNHGSKSSIKISDIAADYGMEPTQLNLKLAELNVQKYDYDESVWKLCDEYVGRGLTITQVFKHLAPNPGCNEPPKHMYWTLAGWEFIYYLLDKEDMRPSEWMWNHGLTREEMETGVLSPL